MASKCVKDKIAEKAYIAYVKEKGFNPQNATHLMKYSKFHKPPFKGITYSAVRRIIANPPDIAKINEDDDNEIELNAVNIFDHLKLALSIIDTKEKLIVFGYIHSDNDCNDIPDIVINYILLFTFFFVEGFDRKTRFDYVGIDGTRQIVYTINNAEDDQNVFGINVIKPDTGIHEWIFKILKNEIVDDGIGTFNSRAMIGIVPKNTNFKKFRYKYDEHIGGWGYKGHAINYNGNFYNAYHGDVYVNGLEMKCNDIIKMIFDTNKRTLEYEINDKNYGIAMDNVPKMDYIMAITMWAATKIQIVEYNHK